MLFPNYPEIAASGHPAMRCNMPLKVDIALHALLFAHLLQYLYPSEIPF